MDEIWKDISGYEGLYQISSLGRIKSLERYAKSKGIKVYHKAEQILKPSVNQNGYLILNLHNNGQKSVRIHRLVAVAFVSNPNNLPCVNHKDGNKLNNHYKNLEWCTHSENNKHAYDMKLNMGAWKNKKGKLNPKSIPVQQFDTNGVLIKEYISLREAGEITGIAESGISCACRGVQKTAGKFIWKYKSNDKNI